jgi:monoamine oxidase
MPPKLTRLIDFDPALPAMRRGLAAHLPQGTLTKVTAVYSRAFWRDQGLTGTAISLDGPIGATFDDSPPGGTPGIVFGFVGGDAARDFTPRPRSERRALVLKELTTLFGSKAASPVDYFESNWREETWSRGCPTAFAPPHALTRFGPALRKHVGRVHWAGTETADYWAGYMDGAVRSGERVVRELLQRL